MAGRYLSLTHQDFWFSRRVWKSGWKTKIFLLSGRMMDRDFSVFTAAATKLQNWMFSMQRQGPCYGGEALALVWEVIVGHR